jgi:hypothetical protein
LAGIVAGQRSTNATGSAGKKNPQHAAGFRRVASTTHAGYFFFSLRTLPITLSARASNSS